MKLPKTRLRLAATAVAALSLAATPVRAAGDVESEPGDEKPQAEQAATAQPETGTKTPAPNETGSKVKTAQKDTTTRKVRIELNLISIKNGEKVRSGI